MPYEKHIEPEYETTIGKTRVRFWYNSKTHKYHVVVETDFLEPWTPIYSKVKGETIINFLKVLDTAIDQ